VSSPSSHRHGNKQATLSEATSGIGGGSDAYRTPLLDIEGVAAWLGTSHRHVRRLVAERRIPYVKIGHYVRFDNEEVATWIDGQRVGSAYPTGGSRRATVPMAGQSRATETQGVTAWAGWRS